MKRITPDESKNYRRLYSEKDFRYSMDCAVAYTLTPSEYGEPWEDVTYYGEAYKDPTGSLYKYQYVYVLVNESVPDICKIGFTKISVEERARQISSATGCITPWFPVYKHKTGNGYLLEQEVHRTLEDLGFRVSHNREGFVIKSQDAIEIIKEIAQKLSKNTQNG